MFKKLSIKDMKIKFSLILGYAITIIAAILLIVICLVTNAKQQASFDRIMDTYVYANEIVTSCRLNANIAARNIREITLFPGTETSAKLRDRIDEVMEVFDKELDELGSVNPVKDGSVEKYISNARKWESEAKEILKALDEERPADARTMIDQKCGPQLNEMADTGGAVDDTLSEMQDDARAVQDKNSKATIIIMILAMLIATAAVIAFAMKIIKSIAEPVEEVRAALIGFSEGKLDIPVDYESKNVLLFQICLPYLQIEFLLYLQS